MAGATREGNSSRNIKRGVALKRRWRKSGFVSGLFLAPPAPWIAFRQRVTAADAVLFVTPEYSRSVPAVLENALDVGSRPYGASVWNRKPGAVVSSSPGAIGAFAANHHLKQSLVFLNVPTMQQPEAYVSHVDKLFDEHDKLGSDGTRKFLQQFMQAFANWIETIRSSSNCN